MTWLPKYFYAIGMQNKERETEYAPARRINQLN